MRCQLRPPHGRSYDRRYQSNSIPRLHKLLRVHHPCLTAIPHVPSSSCTSDVLRCYNHAPPKSFPQYTLNAVLCQDGLRWTIPALCSNYRVPTPFDPTTLYHRARRQMFFVRFAGIVSCSAKNNPDDDPERLPPPQIRGVFPSRIDGWSQESDNGICHLVLRH